MLGTMTRGLAGLGLLLALWPAPAAGQDAEMTAERLRGFIPVEAAGMKLDGDCGQVDGFALRPGHGEEKLHTVAAARCGEAGLRGRVMLAVAYGDFSDTARALETPPLLDRTVAGVDADRLVVARRPAVVARYAHFRNQGRLRALIMRVKLSDRVLAAVRLEGWSQELARRLIESLDLAGLKKLD
jgi:hypothetical protein